MSGTNAHMVVESYEDKRSSTAESGRGPFLLLLSAQTEEALISMAAQLTAALESPELREASMDEISYTLMAGRHHFSQRFALVVEDRTDAIDALKKASEKEPDRRWLRGEMPRNFRTEVWPAGGVTGAGANYLYLAAEQYCRGCEILPAAILGSRVPRRVHLPAYPFLRKEYRSYDRPEAHPEAQIVEAPMAEDVDWAARLARYAGKKICILCSNEEDGAGMQRLLRKLESACQLQVRLDIDALPVSEEGMQALSRVRPEIILVTGDANRLVRSLMQADWDQRTQIYCFFHSCDGAPQGDQVVRSNGRFSWKSIGLDTPGVSPEDHGLLVREWLLDDPAGSAGAGYAEVHYRNGKRYLERYPAALEDWLTRGEERKKAGDQPSIEELRNMISVEEMEKMAPSLVEKIYALCHVQDENPAIDPTAVIRETIIDVLQIERLDDEEALQRYGLDSIKAMRLSVRLEKRLNRPIQPQWFLTYPTVSELSKFLQNQGEVFLT
jgi:acyl carrier protein